MTTSQQDGSPKMWRVRVSDPENGVDDTFRHFTTESSVVGFLSGFTGTIPATVQVIPLYDDQIG